MCIDACIDAGGCCTRSVVITACPSAGTRTSACAALTGTIRATRTNAIPRAGARASIDNRSCCSSPGHMEKEEDMCMRARICMNAWMRVCVCAHAYNASIQRVMHACMCMHVHASANDWHKQYLAE